MATANNNNVCAACPAGKYHDGIAAKSEDADGCYSHSMCGPGFGLTALGTAVKDTVCGSCGSGFFSSVSELTTCQVGSECDKGTEMTSVALAALDTMCTACASGYYKDMVSATAQCIKHDPCPIARGILTAGTATTNTVCRDCDGGEGREYSDVVDYSACKPHTPAAIGEGIVSREDEFKSSSGRRRRLATGATGNLTYLSNGTASSNTVIETCTSPHRPRSFSAVEAFEVCQEWRTCGKGSGLLTEGSSSMDAVCENCCPGGVAPCPRWSDTIDRSKCKATTATCPIGSGVCPASSDTAAPPSAGSPTSDQLCCPCNDPTPWTAGAADTLGLYSNVEDGQACSVCAASCGATKKVGTVCVADSDLTCVDKDGCTGETWSETALEPCDLTHSDCAVGQGLLVSGTAGGDTKCEACPTGKYSDESSKARCVEYDACGPGLGRAENTTLGTDKNIVCEPCLVSNGKFSADTSTELCDDVTVCAVGNGVATAATNTSDTLCRICDGSKEFSDVGPTANRSRSSPSGNAFSSVDEVTTCKPLTVCSPGQELDAYGTSSKDTTCKPCPAGTFKPDSGPGPCKAHKPCPLGSGVTFAPTNMTDTGCGPCPANTFSSVEDVSLCRDYTTCAVGTGVVAGTTSSGLVDLQCAPCAEGSFSDKNDRSACTEHRQCPIGMGAVMWDGTPFTRRLMAAKEGSKEGTTPAPVAQSPSLSSFTADTIRSEEELVRMARPRHLRATSKTAASDSAAAPTAAFTAASTTTHYGTDGKAGSPFLSVMSRHERRLACTRDGSFCHPDYDVGCQNCSFGGFFSTKDATELCIKCAKPCGIGMKESVPCTQTHDRECVDSAACIGTTWSSTGKAPCDRTHSTCPVGEGILPGGKGTATRDTLCVACEGSTFSDVNDMTACKTHGTCGIGQGVARAGSNVTDSLCEACASGFFSLRDTNGPCDECAPTCGAFYDQILPCSAFTDRVCRLQGARWSPEGFGPCSCGRPSIKTRPVPCQAPSIVGETILLATVSDQYCDSATKPISVTVCTPTRVECPTGVVGGGSGVTVIDPGANDPGNATGGAGGVGTGGAAGGGIIILGPGRVSMDLWWLAWIIPLMILLCCCCFWWIFCCFRRRHQKTLITRNVHHPQGCTCDNCKTLSANTVLVKSTELSQKDLSNMSKWILWEGRE